MHIFAIMETKATFVCKLCDQFECPKQAGLKKLRVHHCNRHKGIKFRQRDYIPKALLKPTDSKILPNTLAKRKRRALYLKAKNCRPRRCAHFKSLNVQCKNFITSPENLASRVRCQSHPIKSVEFANKFGVLRKCGVSLLLCKESLIPNSGRGVFAGRYATFQPGDIVTQFCGDWRTQEDRDNGNCTTGYTLECAMFSNRYLSGISEPQHGKGFGSLINRGNTTHPNNVEFCFVDSKTDNEAVYFRCTKFVGAGDELYSAYGSSMRIESTLE
jgi:hypothetical protein